MSKMSNLHAHLTDLGHLPEYPDDTYSTGSRFVVENSDEYIATGRNDERGQPLLVAASCPAELRDEFAVPADGIELRHGPLSAILGTCDVCNEPITDERPGGRSIVAGIETFAHGDHAVEFYPTTPRRLAPRLGEKRLP